jgi:uncharacterized protein
MDISFDPKKRDKTLAECGIDFADAGKVFAGSAVTERSPQNRGEDRFVTAGFLDGRFVVVVWTQREDSRRIISMRYGHADERDAIFDDMGRPR